MRARIYSTLIAGLGVAACAGDLTLQQSFEQQMRDDGMDGYSILHVEEHEGFGLIMFTSWTEEYIDNKDRPGITYWERADGRWETRTGTDCSQTGIARLGLMGNGHLYCATFAEGAAFQEIMVGGEQGTIVSVTDSKKTWYAVADSGDLQVVGVTEDLREIALN